MWFIHDRHVELLRCMVPVTMPCFLMNSSESLYIAVYIRKTQVTKLNLSCINSYFTLSSGSRCCWIQMLKIIVCWKVISFCVIHKFIQNIGKLSNKQHQITHPVVWMPNYTNTRIYNTRKQWPTQWPFRCFPDWANVVHK